MRSVGFVSVVGLIAVGATFRPLLTQRSSAQEESPAAADPAPAAPAPIAEVAPTPPPAPVAAVRIALQAGHWKAMEAPDELAGLRDNGTSFQGKPEWEVNLEIANRTADALRKAGYEVDVLPATVPPRYKSDLFISIHADGNNSSAVSGYRVAAPSPSFRGRGRNRTSPGAGPSAPPAPPPAEFAQRTQKSQEFADLLVQTYGRATGIPLVPTLTRRMQNYYAFNSRRYQHALDPATIGVIIETGFLTSPKDRQIIVSDQDRSVRGIVDAVMRFRPLPAIPPLDLPARTPPPRPGTP